MKLENIDKVVMATCALHNFLRRKRGENYMPMTQSDIDDGHIIDASKTTNCLKNLQKGHNRHSSELAKAVLVWLDLFKNYFCDTGALPWQENHI